MNKFAGKFTLIGITTLLGLLSFWPPSTKLKTGIDLSGGTILVYEIKKDGQPANFDIDELITSLKRRINPEGVLDIPIRKLGGDRIEIILPKASAEEVEEVKEKMTKVGALEFRILANRKHDAAVIDRAMGKNGLTDLPKKYMWARLGETVTGKNPVVSDDKKTITDPTQHLERTAYAGQPITLNGKTSSGTDQSITSVVASNTATSITLTKPITLSSLASYTIDYNPSEIRGPMPGAPPRPMDEIVRDEPVSPGRTVRYILCDVDRQDVTGGDLARVYPTQDDRLQPAVGFTFNRPGARRFGTLTREHLPEEEGAFKYRLAILLDSIVRSAPTINSQIKDQGIIEFGSGGNPKEVARLIEILNAGKLPATLNPEPLQEENIGPTLGEDTIAKGITAIVISMLIVPIFMIYLLPLRRPGGGRRARAEHDSPARLDGGLAGELHAARPGGLRADDRHGGRRERACLRANPRGGRARGGDRAADPQRLQPGVADDLRLAHHDLPVGAGALLRRHRRGEGLRADADHRHGLEPVHRGLRLAA